MMDEEKLETFNLFLGEITRMHGLIFEMSFQTTDRQVGRKEWLASHFFTKACLTVDAIKSLIPDVPKKNNISNVDNWPSLCVITRALIDVYYIFYYLTINCIDDQESDFRWMIMEYKNKCQILRYLLKLSQNRNDTVQLRDEIDSLLKQLVCSNYFENLNEKGKSFVLDGEKRFVIPKRIITQAAGIHPDNYDFFYHYLSQHVHSDLSAVNVMASFSSNSPERLRYFYYPMKICCIYIALFIRDFVKIFPDIDRLVDDKTKAFLGICERQMCRPLSLSD